MKLNNSEEGAFTKDNNIYSDIDIIKLEKFT